MFGGVTRAAGHNVRVHINRINRVADRDFVVFCENIADVAAVALRAVGNKDFGGFKLHAVGAVVVFQNRLKQKILTVFRRIAVERFGVRHFFDRFVHRVNDRGRQRARYVADTEADDFAGLFGVRLFVFAHLTGNARKQVAAFDFQKVFVDFHGFPPWRRKGAPFFYSLKAFALDFDFTGANHRRGPRHKDVAAVSPLDFQRAAQKPDGDFFAARAVAV